MLAASSNSWKTVLAVLAVALPALGGCSSREMPVYRDLADIPERPDVTSGSVNQEDRQNLMEERARTMEAAENLRREPVTTPEPAPPPPPP